MAILVVDCPHCGATKTTMTVVGSHAPSFEEAKAFGQGALANVFATCPHCLFPIGFRVRPTTDSLKTNWQSFSQTVENAVRRDNKALLLLGLSAEMIRTPPLETDLPQHLPAAAAKAFAGAEKTHRIPEAAEQAAMGYRRSVEMAIKELRPDLEGSLQKRIDALTAEGAIPKAMQEWAHQVRMIGNDGAHEVTALEPGDLLAARGFADAFLRFFVTLPKEVELRRAAVATAAAT